MNDENEVKKTTNDELKKTINCELEVKKILLEKFKLAATIQDNYNTLFWTRTTVFFAINTALFAAYGLIVTKFIELKLQWEQAIPIILIMVIISIVGVLLSVLWFQIHKRATYLQEYYRFRASVIEDEIGIGPEIFGETYMIDTSKDEWEKVYKGRAKIEDTVLKAVDKFAGKELLDGIKAGKIPGSLRKKLDTVYIVFIIAWSLLLVLGFVVPYVCSSKACT